MARRALAILAENRMLEKQNGNGGARNTAIFTKRYLHFDVSDETQNNCSPP